MKREIEKIYDEENTPNVVPNLPVKTTGNLPSQNENKIETLVVVDERFEVQTGLAEVPLI